MRLRAGQAVEAAKKRFNTTLDFSPESVEQVEVILGKIHERHKNSSLTDSDLVKESMKWGSYIGEIIGKIHACHWAMNSTVGGEGSFPVVYEDKGESFPVRWCYKRIKNGDEDNVWHKFTILVLERDTPDAFKATPED